MVGRGDAERLTAGVLSRDEYPSCLESSSRKPRLARIAKGLALSRAKRVVRGNRVKAVSLPHPSPKKRVPWLAYLWPGLPHLWVEGSWAGLALAIGFTALVNLAIVNLFIWPELLEPRAKWVGGAALLVLWLAALWETHGELRRQAERRRAEREERPDPETERLAGQQADADRQLVAAQRAYLAGDWAGAERLLLELTKTHNEDIEAHLLLATLWRHLGRSRYASRRLKRIARLDAARAWRYEIERELELSAQPDVPMDSDEGQLSAEAA
jgi:hypothetical protein